MTPVPDWYVLALVFKNRIRTERLYAMKNGGVTVNPARAERFSGADADKAGQLWLKDPDVEQVWTCAVYVKETKKHEGAERGLS